MEKQDDGGFAFPGGCILDKDSQHSGMPFWDGMSLRDYFAAKVLPVIFANFLSPESSWDGHGDVAESAYRLADAMLVERAK